MNAARNTFPVTILRALRPLVGAAALALASVVPAWALPVIPSPAADFTAAESGRTFMTSGGVWNGSAEVTNTTGDTFSVAYNNVGDATAYDFAPKVTLQTGFQLVAGTAQVVTSPATPGLTVTASQVGTQISFVFSPAGYDLPAGANITISFGVRAAGTVGDGSYNVTYDATYALTDGGAAVSAAQTVDVVSVRRGATTINVTPKQQVKAVGDTADFTVTISNTGLGGLFDVKLDESAINPGNNLQLLSLTKTAPALAATANVAGDVLTLPYLAPGESFTATVQAVVLSCGTIVNIVSTDDRNGTTAASDQAPVQLDLKQPLVGYTAPAITLDYNTPVGASLTIGNTGQGDARSFTLRTSLPSLPVTISNVGAGWSYDSGTGVFTYTANGGVIADGASATLTFDIAANDVCANSGAGSVSYEARYTNGCGDAYVIPQEVGSVAAAADTPSVSLDQTVSANRIAIIESGAYALTLSAANLANISTDPLVVTETLPAGVTYAAHTASAGGVSVVGNVVTWTVAKSALSSAQTLDIDFTVDNEPCLAGDILSANAVVSATSSQGCSLGGAAAAGFLVSNNPGLASSQFFNVSPAAPDGIFETGAASADAVHDHGEGEFIPFVANYAFGPAYPGTWVGTTYEDDFGGVSQQTLVPGTLTYTFNGGAAAAVPPAAITTLGAGFRIDLSFLGTAVAGTTLQINYRTTISDAALSGGATLSVLQRTNLIVAGIDSGAVPGGICDETTQYRFTQGAYYTVGRAAATIGLGMASTLEVCREETLTITVGNANAEDAHNLLVTLLNDGTKFIYPATQTPVYGGAFNAGNIVYTANGGANPAFEYTGDPLTAQGTIQVKVIRRATSPVDTTGFSARVDYDSSETDAAGARAYASTAAYAPSIVRKATLALTVTPGTITVAGDTASYVVYVTNTDAGTAYESKVNVTLPTGITADAAAMNAANTGIDVYVSGQNLEFDLGDIPSGATVQRTVVGDVGAIPGCNITITSEKVQASWGCEGDIFFTTERVHPSFFFPAGQMQVVHDTTNSFVSLCSDGLVEIIVRNTGATSINNIVVNDVLPSAQGILFKPGTVEISVNGGAWTALGASGNPVVAGDTHTWSSAQIPDLAKLVPVGATIDGETTYEVRIRFDLNQTETVAGQSPMLGASATGQLACGASVNYSPGSGFPITVFQPRVNLVKTGRNLTAGETAYAETVYGGYGDVIEWRIQLANTGNLAALNVRLSDPLSGSGGSAEFSTVAGLGGGGAAYAGGTVLSVSDLAAGTGSATYYIRETLGNNCVTASPLARVTWGCSDPGAGLHNTVDQPGDPDDVATIVMVPAIAGGADIQQTITYLNGGRARVDVAVTNTGGNAYDLVLTDTFPNAGMVLDTGVAPAFSRAATYYSSLTSVISGVTVDNTNTLAPKFTLTNGGSTAPMLRYGDRVTLTYYVRPTVYDTTMAAAFPDLASAEATGTLDPNPPGSGNNTIRVDYVSSCGGASFSTTAATIDLRTPDLDITATSPGNSLLTGSTNANYTFTITNSGDAGSVADYITADFPDLGSGWTINSITLTTAGTGGINGATITSGGQFSTAQMGTLSQGQTALITVNARYSGTPGPLTLKLRVRGESRPQDGSATGDYYSQDQRAQRIVGTIVTKSLKSTSESDSTGANVLVGEEVTYLLKVDFFGAEEDLTNVTIRDTPADSNYNAHTNLAYVSHTFTANNELTFTPSTPVPVTVPASLAASRVNFTAGTITAADINADVNTFETDLVVRVLNVADNTHNKILRNNLGVEFTYLGQKFRSNNGDDGLTGTATTTSGLHKETDVTVRRPTVTIAKQVRNVTTTTAFGATAEGQAGDTLEYRIVVTNPSVANAAPLYSISVADNVPGKLVLLSTDIGADTTGDDSPDVLTTGVAGGDGVDITFDQANTNIPSAGSNFDRLDPGQSVTLLYRVTLAQSVNPSETLTNSATVTGYTLPAPSGNQTAPLGAQDSATGSDAITAAASATAAVTIIAINQDKVITDYSGLPADDDRVTIGEQIRYRVTLQLPLGTAPDLRVMDTLPAGLALVGTPVVDIGADIAADNEPPAFTQTGGGQTLAWSFGQAVASGPARAITIDYVAQVRNIAGNTAGATLTNNATYTFTGLSFIPLTQRTVTVAEPGITATHGVRNATRNPTGPYLSSIAATDAIAPDAGDLIEYQISITNNTGANISSAYDFNIVDTMPAGVTYVGGWAGFDTISGVTPSSFATFEPDVAGQVLTWGRGKTSPVNIDIAPGGTLVFHYRVRVEDPGRPLQSYDNAVVVDWTSLDGSPGPDLGTAVDAAGNALGERDGSGTAPNAYRAERDAPVVARNVTTLVKTKAGDTLPRDAADAPTGAPSGFRIGDLVTYTVTMPVQEGTLAAFTVADTLPSGLAFHDTVSITPATGTDGFTYTTPAVILDTAPDVGDTGALTWSFGTLVNAGDNDTGNDEMVVVYRARVVDPSGLAVTPVDQALNNSATVAFTLADTGTHTSAASVAGVTVRQPRLTLAKAIVSPAVDALGNYVRRPGDTASYRLTVANTGTAPAYNIELTDTLPVGLRATAPVLTAATRNGVDVLATQTAPAWDNGTGAYVFSLADGEPLLPGQSLVLTYTVTVDNNDALKGATLTNSATIDWFFSLPAGDAEAASRRAYDPVGPAIANLVIGLRIDGFVYHDIDLSNARDGAEDWTGLKPTVFANLVADNGGSPIVFRTVTVAPGAGAFSFDYLPPGDFDIILTDAAGNTVARRPANWLFQNPAAGLIAATINQGTGDLVDRNLGLQQGAYSPTVAPTITKAHTGETIPAAGPQTSFRIGDLVTYTLDIFPHEGANTSFVVADTLPAGLAFYDTVSIAQVAGAARYTYTTPSGANAPATNAEGPIGWNFGTFTNAIADPANNTLRITYRARVINTGASPLAVPGASPAATTDGPLTNSAGLTYDNTGVSAATLSAGPAATDITVDQPRLTIAKVLSSPALNRLAPGATGAFTVTVANDGTAPAYNIRVTDTLPAGMRVTAPVLTAATLNGTNVLSGLTPVWTAAAGTYVFNLSNSQILLPGENLVLTYQFTVDTGATRSATLTNSAVVDQYFSKPSSSTAHRRQYAAAGPATADIIVGLRIAGAVYEDADLSDTLNGAEGWNGATKPTVHVNLVDGGGAVYRTATITPGSNTYDFTNLPADDYTLVVATTDTATTSDRPANWLYRAPNNGTRDLTATTDDQLDQNFGFWQDTLATAQIAKSQAGGTLPLSAPADGYRVGDLVTYTLDLSPQEGDLTSLVVTDDLPAGLVFVATTSIAQVSGAPRYTYTTPAGVNAPAAGATGTLTWTFGDFANALAGPADNTLRITYTARVTDAGSGALPVPAASPATTTASLTNSAALAYDNADGDPVSAGPATATLTVEQPRLVIAKTRLAPVADNIVMPGDDARFRLTVTNNGTGPAYNVTLTDTLPIGLRAATPTLEAATLNGANVLGSLSAPAYTAGTGAWTVALADAQILLPGETLVLDYTVTVDAGAAKGSVLTNSARVDSYASKASADTTDRRVYDPTAPSTQNLIVGQSVAGSVYHQLIPNGVKDAGTEDWTSGAPVVVNLVTNAAINYGGFSIGANQVLRSIAVSAGAGEFTFGNVPDGAYRIIVTDTALNTTPVAPDSGVAASPWHFDTPATGSITPVTVSGADVADQNLGLYQGRVVSGRVYNDAAPFGSRETEDWTGGVSVVVNLVDTYGVPVVHASITVPAGVGTYRFEDVPPGNYQVIVAPAGQTTATAAAAPTNWVFVQPDDGTIGSFDLTTSDITGQELGLTLGRTVSGYVFNDTNPNGAKDGFEDWLTGTPVFVNLVRASDNTVVASASVPIGAGAYAFANIGPGDYRVVVTNASGQATAQAPASWLFRNPATGSLSVTVAGADLTDRNFALFRGRTLSGRVFRDNGAGGAAANNGLQTGSEPGIGNVTVRLLSSGGSVLDITQSNGAGDFVLRIPADTVDGATLIVEETNPPQHRSTGADVGDSGGAYNLAADRLTFTYNDADVAGVRFGDVPDSSLLTDGAQTILPGTVAFYRHTFTAGTAGMVTFTTAETATPSLPWTQVLVRDLNCNGAVDSGEPIIDGVAIAVQAGEEICLVVKVSSPPNAGYGAKHKVVVTALLDYDNSALDETMSREDVTTVGPTSSSGLTLVKSVDKTAAKPGEIITYTVTYTNSGAEDLTDLFIDDRTPAYTVLAEASSYTLPLPDGLTVGTVTEPAVGDAGGIRWTFGGVLSPGASGSVVFKVKVRE